MIPYNRPVPLFSHGSFLVERNYSTPLLDPPPLEYPLLRISGFLEISRYSVERISIPALNPRPPFSQYRASGLAKLLCPRGISLQITRWDANVSECSSIASSPLSRCSFKEGSIVKLAPLRFPWRPFLALILFWSPLLTGTGSFPSSRI